MELLYKKYEYISNNGDKKIGYNCYLKCGNLSIPIKGPFDNKSLIDLAKINGKEIL